MNKNTIIELLIIQVISICSNIIAVNGNISQNSSMVNWDVNENDTYNWFVATSNEESGFYPKESIYKLSIKDIISADVNNSQINATIKVYNSTSSTWGYMKDNELFQKYNRTSNSVQLYKRMADIGFFIPSNYKEEFYLAVKSYFDDHKHYNHTNYIISDGILTKFWTNYTQRNQILTWEFYKGYITSKFTVENATETLYVVELDITEKKTNGDENNQILLIMIIVIISVISAVLISIGILKKKGIILNNVNFKKRS